MAKVARVARGGGGAATSRRSWALCGIGLGAGLRGVWSLSVDVIFFFLFFFSGCFTITIIFGPSNLCWEWVYHYWLGVWHVGLGDRYHLMNIMLYIFVDV